MSHVHRGPDPTPRRSEGRRRGYGPVQLTSALVMAAVWMLLWGRFDLPTLLMGLALGIAAAWVFPLPRLQYAGMIRPHWWVVLIGRFAFDLVVASVSVALAGITRGPTVRNAVIKVPLRTNSDFILTQVVEFTSLVPGSVVLETRRGIAPPHAQPAAGEERESNTVYVHVMDLRGPDAVESARRSVAALEARVIRAFGTREDYVRLRTERAFRDGGARDG